MKTVILENHQTSLYDKVNITLCVWLSFHLGELIHNAQQRNGFVGSSFSPQVFPDGETCGACVCMCVRSYMLCAWLPAFVCVCMGKCDLQPFVFALCSMLFYTLVFWIITFTLGRQTEMSAERRERGSRDGIIYVPRLTRSLWGLYCVPCHPTHHE